MLTTSLGVEVGTAVVRQRADASEGDDLRRRGERMAEAEHAGVVRVLASRPAGDGWELIIEHGGPSLASVAGSRAAGPLAELVASVASTLADLHDRGIAHGRLDATHVLLGGDGCPRLCGFAPLGGAPADDVAALGAVLVDQLDALPHADERLRALAAGAQAEPASRRPSARRLASALRDIASPAPRVAPWRGLAAAVAVAGLAGALVVGLRSDGRPLAATPTTSPAIASCVARAGHPLSATACGRAVAVDGVAVVVDGRRHVVGRPGDEVAVGDWDCAGELRAAVLRPATGEVLVLAAFPAVGSPPVTRAVRVPGARSLAVQESADGCPTLGVLDGLEG